MTDINRYLDFDDDLFRLWSRSRCRSPPFWAHRHRHPDAMAAKRPYIIVGAFVVGMLLTPPDVISQTLLAVPMWLLFGFGIFVSTPAAAAIDESAGGGRTERPAVSASAAMEPQR